MMRVEKTIKPPKWEKDMYQNEIEWYVPPHLFSINRSVSTGLTFYSNNKHKKEPLAFVYISPYKNKNNENICRIERLIFYQCKKSTQLKVIKKIFEIANNIYGQVDIFETEVFSEVKSPIFFPSTLYFLGSSNKKEQEKLYRDFGFEVKHIKHCYEIDLRIINDKNIMNLEIPINFHNIKREEWHKYWLLWGETDYCLDTSYLFKSGVNAKFSDFIPYLTDPAHVLIFQSQRTLRNFFNFRSKLQHFLGFVHWAPNIYKLASPDATCFSLGRFKEVQTINEAKIFKLNIRTESNINLDKLYQKMIYLTLQTLKEKGIEICQIGNFIENNPIFFHIRDVYKGKHVHSVAVLQKSNIL